MCETYRDPWQDYKAIFESTKKKFLKKPNYAQALAEYENLALRFQDEEFEHYAGLCNIQMAKIHETLGNWSMQYSRLLKAARYFKQAEHKADSMCSMLYSENLNLMQDCYNKATKLILDHSGVWLAGLHSMEVGHALDGFGKPHLALKYLDRGSRLLEVEHNSRIAALLKLAECQCKLKYYSDALTTLDELWTAQMKNVADPRFASGKDLLKDCEITTVLLLLKIKSNDISARHRFLLSMYSESFFEEFSKQSMNNGEEKVKGYNSQEEASSSICKASDEDESISIDNNFTSRSSEFDGAPWNKYPLKDSCLTAEQFLNFYDFILSLRNGEIFMAKKSFSRLKPFLNNVSLIIAKDMLSSLIHKGSI